MNQKSLIQLIIILLIIIISISLYLSYFNKGSKNLKTNSKATEIENKTDQILNYIENINYTSDANGNKYQVTAEQAEIKIENSDVMFLTNVIAYIFIKDSDTVKITSNFGEYNSKNYDTIFSENVIVIYPGHKITGEYLDFSFLKNLGTMSTNVVYNGEKTNLFADKLEINLSTKDTKIFMNDASEKVLIEGTK